VLRCISARRCLFEIGSTPQSKLQLLTHGFQESELAERLAAIDVDAANCYDKGAEALIRKKIKEWYTSIANFTAYLKLRFLLRPLNYDKDIQALRERSTDTWQFETLHEFLAAPPTRRGSTRAL
jgi:hypothetical protein